ncbi:hypothetical protein LUW77_17150 [Streptomyces radiopugnans]|nr:hypothetical protein LUW77_17150 [Streptomyces radiopugnans]
MHAPLRRGRKRRIIAATAAASLATPLLLAASATSAVAKPDPGKQGEKLARQLVKKADADGAMRHLRAFQAIADAKDDNRAATRLLRLVGEVRLTPCSSSPATRSPTRTSTSSTARRSRRSCRS